MLQAGASFLNREQQRSIWEASRAFGFPLWEGRFPKEKAGTTVPASSSSTLALKRLTASFSSAPLSWFSFWPPFSWASIFLLFSLAQLSSSPPSWPASSPLALAQALEPAPLPRVPRRRSPVPLPRFRRSLPFRPPVPRRPAVTAHCHPRNCPSRNPCRPPLGNLWAPLA